MNIQGVLKNNWQRFTQRLIGLRGKTKCWQHRQNTYTLHYSLVYRVQSSEKFKEGNERKKRFLELWCTEYARYDEKWHAWESLYPCRGYMEMKWIVVYDQFSFYEVLGKYCFIYNVTNKACALTIGTYVLIKS